MPRLSFPGPPEPRAPKARTSKARRRRRGRPRRSPCPFEFISLAVRAIASTVVSKSTRRSVGISLLAMLKPIHAFTAPYRAALDAGQLDVAGHRVAGEPEVVLQRRFRRVGHDLRLEVVSLRQERRAHRGSHANLRLAPALGPGERRVVLAEVADDRGREHPRPDLVLRHLPAAFAERIDQRRHHARRPARGRGHHEVAAGVLLGAGQRVGARRRPRRADPGTCRPSRACTLRRPWSSA